MTLGSAAGRIVKIRNDAGKKIGVWSNNNPKTAPTVPGEALEVPDEKELARLISRGDEAAFRTLVDREGRYLYGIAHALTGNAADAEDMVQETFAGAFRTRFRGESSLRTWLVRILVRRVGMLRRSSWWRRRHASPDAGQDGRPAVDIPVSSSAEDADVRLDLTAMLATLSVEHREIIILRELQGLSYEEMAAVLNIPRGTIQSRLHRARQELRARFKEYLRTRDDT